MNQWMFPPGTKLWKEFVVGGARLETRLIWKRPSGAWYFTVYRWSTDGSIRFKRINDVKTNRGCS